MAKRPSAKAADGSGAPEELQRGEEKTAQSDGVHAGRRYVPLQLADAGPLNISRASVTGDRKAERVLDAEFSETNAEVSHDGRWMEYQSNESGRVEVYVRPWPDVNAGRWLVSTGGGTRPCGPGMGASCSTTGRARSCRCCCARGRRSRPGTPTVVVRVTTTAGQTGRQYDVSPDGKRFLLIKDAAVDGSVQARNQIVVVQNWFEELQAPCAGRLTAQDQGLLRGPTSGRFESVEARGLAGAASSAHHRPRRKARADAPKRFSVAPVNADHVEFGIHDPVLSHAGPLVEAALDRLVPLPRAGRADLDDELGRALTLAAVRTSAARSFDI